MSQYIAVITTVDSEELANTIAGELVRAGIAACVNIIPNITSVYKWKGEVCTDRELILLVKSRAEHYEAIRAQIKALHRYEVPEVILIPIGGGDKDYLAWIDAVTQTHTD